MKKIKKKHPSKYAALLNNLAILYENIEKYKKAELLYKQALQISENASNQDVFDYVGFLNNLASLYCKMKQYTKSDSLYKHVLKIRKKMLGDKHIYYASTMCNLANLYSDMKRYKEAESLYEKVLQIRKKTLGSRHKDYISSVNGLFKCYILVQDFEKATYCVNQIITSLINSTLDLTDSLKLSKNWNLLQNYTFKPSLQSIQTLKNISLLQKTKYRAFKNIKDLKIGYLADQIALQIFKKVQNGFIEQMDKLRFLKKINTLTKDMIKLCLTLIKEKESTKKYAKNAFSYVEDNKSVLLLDALKGNRARALGDLPDSLAFQEIALQQKKQELKKKQLEAQNEQKAAIIRSKQNDLNLEITVFLKSIKNKYPKYHALKYQNITAKVEDVQKFLDENTLFLEYFIADTIIYLFVIEKYKLQLLPIDMNRETLEKKIKTLHYLLSDYNLLEKKAKKAYDLYTQYAHWFYQKLLAPALKNKQKQNLIIVPDGKLGYLPFEAFLTQAVTNLAENKYIYSDLPYLLRDYNISYNYSATLWKENYLCAQQQNTAPLQMLACAADYSIQEGRAAQLSSVQKLRGAYITKQRSSLKPLLFAQGEVATLSQFFSGDFMQGRASSEAFFKKNAHKYGILHLAMHTAMHPRVPMLSALVFTEDGDSTEDNFLQAYEISRLHLNADLVVLSACKTGYGKFQQGEGILSLARSFMYAGASSLLVSMWPVNDASTAILMQAFYHNIAKGLPKDLALQRAKLTYIAKSQGKYTHPAYWSTFVLLGDVRPVNLAFKQRFSYFMVLTWVGGGLAFLLLALKIGIKIWPKAKMG